MKPLAAVLALSGIVAVGGGLAELCVRRWCRPQLQPPPRMLRKRLRRPGCLPAPTREVSDAFGAADRARPRRDAGRRPIGAAAGSATPAAQQGRSTCGPAAPAHHTDLQSDCGCGGPRLRAGRAGHALWHPGHRTRPDLHRRGTARQWPCGMVARTAFRSLLARPCPRLRAAARSRDHQRGRTVQPRQAGCRLVGGVQWLGDRARRAALTSKQGKARARAHLGIYGEAPAPVVEFQALSEPPPLAGAAPVAAPRQTLAVVRRPVRPPAPCRSARASPRLP